MVLGVEDLLEVKTWVPLSIANSLRYVLRDTEQEALSVLGSHWEHIMARLSARLRVDPTDVRGQLIGAVDATHRHEGSEPSLLR